MKGAAEKIQKEWSQHDKDWALYDSIYFGYPEKEVRKWLDLGANVNCIGVQKKSGPTQETPLAVAVRFSRWDVVPLLLERGANPRVNNLNGNAVILSAAANGSDVIMEALLSKYPDLAGFSYDEMAGFRQATLLIASICSLYPLQVIKYGIWDSPEIQTQLMDYFNQKPGVERPTQALTVQYAGNGDVLAALLDAREDLVLRKTDEGQGFSALDVAYNPRAYKDCFLDINGKDTIRCLTTDHDPNPNILTFEIDLADRGARNKFVKRSKAEKDPGNTRPPVRLIYDFTQLQQFLTERAERLPQYQGYKAMKFAGQLHGTLQEQGQQLHLVKQELSVVAAKQKQLCANQDEQDRFEEWLQKPKHENLKVFHDTLQGKLRDVLLSFQVANGGAAGINVRDKHISSIESVLGVIGRGVSLIPLVGNTAQGVVSFFGFGVSKVAATRQKNIAASVASLMQTQEASIIASKLAKKLTKAYAHQLTLLQTPKEAESKQDLIKKRAQKLKNKALATHFVSPAEQIVMFTMLQIVDHLYNADKIGEAVKERGLDEVLFSLLIQQQAPQKITDFWTTLSKNALNGGLLSQSGSLWHPREFYMLPGIRVPETDRYYVHSKSRPEIYGWRLVPQQALENIPGLKAAEPLGTLPEDLWIEETKLVVQQQVQPTVTHVYSQQKSSSSSSPKSSSPTKSSPTAKQNQAAVALWGTCEDLLLNQKKTLNSAFN